jgi:hypothetical protein
MRTTVTIDDDVFEAAQAHSQATGKRLGKVLSEMARQALLPAPRGSATKRRGKGRFAAFEVPADAGMIPASRVQKAIDEDGLV